MSSRFVWILVTICLVIALCLPASVGVNQVLAYQTQPESSGYENMPQSPGYLTIYGRWLYPDRSGNNVPAKRFIAWVYTDTNPWLAYDYTDDSGYFIIGPFSNPGKIKVKIYSYYYPVAGHEITVAPPGGSSWDDAHVYSPEGEGFGPFDDGTRMLDEACMIPQNWDWKRAFWIKNDLQDGFDFLPDKVGDYFAEWQWLYEFPIFGSHFCPCEDPINYACASLGHICINYDDADGASGRDTVIHEVGHAVMWYAYNQYFPLSCAEYILSNCPAHNFNLAISQKCAWIEGWADFWLLAVQNDSWYGNDDLEYQNWMSPSNWAKGDAAEVCVAGTLWDLYDTNTDGFDKYLTNTNPYIDDIWATFYRPGEKDNTFEQFYNKWPSNSKPAITACAYQNSIFYDDGPQLKEAVDDNRSDPVWTTGGNAKWFGEIYESYDGVDAAQSGYVGTNGFAWIQTSVNGPGTLYFWWKNSGHNLDELTFYKDNIEQSSHLHGGSSWQQGVYNVSSSGTHTFKWQYKEVYDWVGEGNQACGYLDRVEWIPNNSAQKLIGADVSDSGNNPHNLGYIFLTRFTAESSGNITDLKVKAGTSGNVKVAIYADSGGEPGALLRATTAGTPVSPGWNIVGITSTAVTAGTNYWLAVRMDTVGAALWNPASGTMRYKGGIDFGAVWPDTAGSGYTNGAYHSLIAGWGTVGP